MNQVTMNVNGYTFVPLLDVEGVSFPLHVVFPEVAVDAWQIFRDRYPETFAPADLLYTRVTCYLLRDQERTILIDAGIGPGPSSLFGNQRGTLLAQLAQHGVSPEMVDTVVLTHLHPDHVGWATRENQPTFPQARYVVSRIDYETFRSEAVRQAMHAIVPGYLDQLFPHEQAGVLEFVEDGAILAPGLRLRLASGHTPGQLTVLIGDPKPTMWILADVFTHPAQITEPTWCSAFDMDREQAINTRHAVISEAATQIITVWASHFPPRPGQIIMKDGKASWVPLNG